MCAISRRGLLLGTALTGLQIADGQQPAEPKASSGTVNKVDPLAPGVYFHEGDISKGLCNNGWIIFKDYVLVIDANFPAGAQTILPKIRSITPKPIRFAFDTHHHGDHAYGNEIWVENGATPVAHTGVIDEMHRYETGYYGGKPGRWEDTAKSRPDVAASRLHPPSVLFPQELFFDDGERRVELRHLGVAHTHGDAVAWLPKERILFSGDACVNGPYNFVGDGNVEKWIATLDAAQKLDPSVVCPGHGPQGVATVLADQQLFFTRLRDSVGALVQSKKTAQEIYRSVGTIRATLSADPRIARYVGNDGIADQVEKVYVEITGQAFPDDVKASKTARLRHARAHAQQLA